MANSPRQGRCQELIADELPACVAGIVVAQAIGNGMRDPSEGLCLLRIGRGDKRKIRGLFGGVVIENGGDDIDGTPLVGVCQLIDVACLEMKQGLGLVDSECEEMNRILVAA